MGAGYASVQVLEGYHSVWVDDPTWNDYLGAYEPLWFFSDSLANGDFRAIYSYTLLEPVYYPW